MRADLAVVIAASSGGTTALRALLPALPKGFPAAVVVLMHQPESGLPFWGESLAALCHLPVEEASERTFATAGVIYLAPPGYHLLLERDGSFSLSREAKVCYVRPSADVLFSSAAACWSDRLAGVVLTGANDDGAEGSTEIRRRGGWLIVQDPAEAEFATMPAEAFLRAGADEVLPLCEIAPHLLLWSRRHV